MANTIKIKIEKFEQINEGVLYVYYVATNLITGEKRTQKNKVEYVGSDIINYTTMTEEQLMAVPIIRGKRYGNEILISSEIREYSEENGDIELEKEGWASDIHDAIAYVMY